MYHLENNLWKQTHCWVNWTALVYAFHTTSTKLGIQNSRAWFGKSLRQGRIQLTSTVVSVDQTHNKSAEMNTTTQKLDTLLQLELLIVDFIRSSPIIPVKMKDINFQNFGMWNVRQHPQCDKVSYKEINIHMKNYGADLHWHSSMWTISLEFEYSTIMLAWIKWGTPFTRGFKRAAILEWSHAPRPWAQPRIVTVKPQQTNQNWAENADWNITSTLSQI